MEKLLVNNITNPLILNDTQYGYKVNKPLDQSGEYVDKKVAEDILEALKRARKRILGAIDHESGFRISIAKKMAKEDGDLKIIDAAIENATK